MEGITMEVCCYNLESVVYAQAAGADRIELCANRHQGGTTPSYGMLEVVRQNVDLPIFSMIRPRGGDFLYGKEELEVMLHDIQMAIELGLEGVVMGALRKDGQVDIEVMRRLIEVARPMEVTFHRAFDVASGPLESLQKLIDLGIDRILTSGQKNKAREGVDLLAQLVQDAGDKIIILVGGGVEEHTLPEIMQKTHALEYHVSAKTKVDSGMTHRNHVVAMGGDPSQSDYEISITDAERIKRIVQLAKSQPI